MPQDHIARPVSGQPSVRRRRSRVDLTGHTFGRLRVLSEGETDPNYNRYWVCRCECGVVKPIIQGSLLHGRSLSCGCLQREVASAMATHGMTGSPEYNAWLNMIKRCTNPNHPEYHRYGDRGIAVCPEWLESFERFYEDVGPRPSPAHSLDREKNDLGYEPGNVRWATIDIQNRNTRRNRLLTHDGITLPMVDWAARIGMKPQALKHRLDRGWSVERALTEPLQPKRRPTRCPSPSPP